MSTPTRRQTVKDLVDEAKKRLVLLLICVFGLSYLMSLTSSSVWVNLPAAAGLIIFCRYLSLDLDLRKRSTTFNSLVDQSSQKKSFELHKLPREKLNWRIKVNSPYVEVAIERFTRHLVSEWVTDLWYSRITPDRDGPEELVQVMNNVIGEISGRAKHINLINLLTRDIIDLICNHLELYRLSQSKIGKEDLRKLPSDRRDIQLKLVLAAENKLHPALFSLEAEHKVLQHLMTGLTLVIFKPEDLQCSFFRYTVRELLACAVFRPLLNLANPRVINEKIESLVLSFSNKADKGVIAEETTIIKPDGSSNPSTEQFPGFLDHSSVGVELVQVRHDCRKISTEQHIVQHIVGNANGMHSQKDQNDSGKIEACSSGAEWAQMLDIITRRKTQVLAPEHLENVWTKGRNYRKKEGVKQFAKQVAANADTSLQSAVPSNCLIENKPVNSTSNSVPASSHREDQGSTESFSFHTNYNGATHHSIPSHQEKPELINHGEVQSDSGSSYQTEDDENNNVTGLDSPGTRVWDSRNKINASVSHIRHPLETSEIYLTKKSGKDHIRHPRTMRTPSGRKRLRSSKQKAPIWQEVERTSFLLGEGHDILNESKMDSKAENMSDDPDVEIWGRVHSGAAAASSLSSISMSKSCISSMRSESSVLADSFIKLRCEVLGANIVKSGSGMFAVYSIAVTDANNNSWSIKRRFRHFEELHRRLKEFPEYNLSLPPKHFLSSGLDVPVVQERCKLLDKYLKMLLQFPTISGSIEVWDFLSVDSQTYMFSDSLSILQTLSVNLDDKSYEKNPKIHSSVEDKNSQLLFKGECLSSSNKEYPAQRSTSYFESDNLGLRKRNMDQSLGTNYREKINNSFEDNSGSDSENRLQKNTPLSSKSDKPNEVSISGADNLEVTSQILGTVNGSTIPTEWVPPNLTAPILNLIDVVFQLQDGGWIRRQAFWVAKQLLQLGMGDAFDDWLIEKIQLLRRGSVVASAINRVENILWPDGIFITRHPKRKPPTPMSTEQQQEANRRAKFVYEIMIVGGGARDFRLSNGSQLPIMITCPTSWYSLNKEDKAPAALVGLVGRKDYELSVQDIYFFLQSPVCLKQLAFEILELLLLSAFPELDDVVRQCHEDKEQFGVLEDSK